MISLNIRAVHLQIFWKDIILLYRHTSLNVTAIHSVCCCYLPAVSCLRHRRILHCRPSMPSTACVLELVRNLMARGDAREGKWRGNWRMEWVASTLTPPPNMVYAALLKLMRAPQLPAVDWTDAPTDLNGLVRFGVRRNLLSARVPSRSARAITSGSSGC